VAEARFGEVGNSGVQDERMDNRLGPDHKLFHCRAVMVVGGGGGASELPPPASDLRSSPAVVGGLHRIGCITPFGLSLHGIPPELDQWSMTQIGGGAIPRAASFARLSFC